MRIGICLLLLLLSPDRTWIDATGRLTDGARDALALLEDAAREGLNPADYEAGPLRALSARIEAGKASAPELATFSLRLERNTVRYVGDLHAGRVDPRTVGFAVAPHPREDFTALVRTAASGRRLRRAAEETAVPAHPLYRPLRAALERYRQLAADASLASRDGDSGLRRLLEALGDVAASEELHEGVKRFQRRHGLQDDGVVGARTRAALRVPLPWRLRQIELALERLRWLPDRDSDRLIGVNIPMFRLWALDGDVPGFSSAVIVGRAARTRTPVFVDALEQIIFRPYWNVPQSIVRGEIVPAMARDPQYLRKHQMEATRQGGELRVRQRPGSSNALGLIKFVFPNAENVYLHGTPAPELFARDRRDFSHGCIRVADPVGLAEWALARDGWMRDTIREAMDGAATRAVTLRQPIRVVLFYVTALVLPEDGLVHFAEDIYGHDRTLDRALRSDVESAAPESRQRRRDSARVEPGATPILRH